MDYAEIIKSAAEDAKSQGMEHVVIKALENAGNFRQAADLDLALGNPKRKIDFLVRQGDIAINDTENYFRAPDFYEQAAELAAEYEIAELEALARSSEEAGRIIVAEEHVRRADSDQFENPREYLDAAVRAYATLAYGIPNVRPAHRARHALRAGELAVQIDQNDARKTIYFNTLDVIAQTTDEEAVLKCLSTMLQSKNPEDVEITASVFSGLMSRYSQEEREQIFEKMRNEYEESFRLVPRARLEHVLEKHNLNQELITPFELEEASSDIRRYEVGEQVMAQLMEAGQLSRAANLALNYNIGINKSHAADVANTYLKQSFNGRAFSNVHLAVAALTAVSELEPTTALLRIVEIEEISKGRYAPSLAEFRRLAVQNETLKAIYLRAVQTLSEYEGEERAVQVLDNLRGLEVQIDKDLEAVVTTNYLNVLLQEETIRSEETYDALRRLVRTDNGSLRAYITKVASLSEREGYKDLISKIRSNRALMTALEEYQNTRPNRLGNVMGEEEPPTVGVTYALDLAQHPSPENEETISLEALAKMDENSAVAYLSERLSSNAERENLKEYVKRANDSGLGMKVFLSLCDRDETIPFTYQLALEHGLGGNDSIDYVADAINGNVEQIRELHYEEAKEEISAFNGLYMGRALTIFLHKVNRDPRLQAIHRGDTFVTLEEIAVASDVQSFRSAMEYYSGLIASVEQMGDGEFALEVCIDYKPHTFVPDLTREKLKQWIEQSSFKQLGSPILKELLGYDPEVFRKITGEKLEALAKGNGRLTDEDMTNWCTAFSNYVRTIKLLEEDAIIDDKEFVREYLRERARMIWIIRDYIGKKRFDSEGGKLSDERLEEAIGVSLGGLKHEITKATQELGRNFVEKIFT